MVTLRSIFGLRSRFKWTFWKQNFSIALSYQKLKEASIHFYMFLVDNSLILTAQHQVDRSIQVNLLWKDFSHSLFDTLAQWHIH